MTNEQFKCCLTGRSAAAAAAARLVLVEGKTVAEAMAITGLAESTVRNAAVRIRRRYRAICAAGPWHENSA